MKKALKQLEQAARAYFADKRGPGNFDRMYKAEQAVYRAGGSESDIIGAKSLAMRPACKRHGAGPVVFSATGYYCTKCKKRAN